MFRVFERNEVELSRNCAIKKNERLDATAASVTDSQYTHSESPI